MARIPVTSSMFGRLKTKLEGQGEGGASVVVEWNVRAWGVQ